MLLCLLDSGYSDTSELVHLFQEDQVPAVASFLMDKTGELEAPHSEDLDLVILQVG
tara:strand:+ start:5512 stop:5679 length:168 start_codon:yes stop_codon:yes gene_type:complete